MGAAENELALARQWYEAGDYPRAEQVFRRHLETEPNNARTLYLLGAICHARGDLAGSKAYLRQALRHEPRHARALNHLGVVLAEQGKLAKAIASFKRAASLQSPFAEAHRNLGLSLTRAGRTHDALASFWKALEAEPDHAPTHFQMGGALEALGNAEAATRSYQMTLYLQPDHAEALASLRRCATGHEGLELLVETFREAAWRRPTDPAAHQGLGVVLAEAGMHAEAAASFAEATRLKPDSLDNKLRLAKAQSALGKSEEALAAYREAARLNPDSHEAHSGAALLLTRLGRNQEAVSSYREMLRLRPGHAPAHNNLGLALVEAGRIDEGLENLRQAVRLRPLFFEAHNNLGNILKQQGRLDEAVSCIRESLRIKPDFGGAHNNLGATYWLMGKTKEAREALRRAIELQPDLVEAFINQGAVLHDMARFGEALNSYSEALRLRPDAVDAHWNRSLVWLLHGDLARGWPEYEWRWKRKSLAHRAPTGPLPDLSSVEGRTVLLRSEQGLGDTIQFIRYASLLKTRGAAGVALACQAPLARLAASCPAIDRVIRPRSKVPRCDFEVPLLSLPGLLGTHAVADIPAAVPYLSADPEQAKRWRDELSAKPGLRVGIAWQGNPGHRKDRDRSVRLERFAPLAAIPGVRLYSLQRGAGSEQLKGGRVQAENLGPRFVDLAETAAAVAALDLVVCVDTAIAHLAGALGVPCWVALSYVPDWRWLLNREDSPWYPTLRLFRQDRPGDWERVFSRMAEALRPLAARRVAETATTPPAAGQAPTPPPSSDRHAEIRRWLSEAGAAKAEDACRKLLDEQPDDGEAWHLLGNIQMSKGSLQDAEQAHRKALEFLPNYAPAWNGLGIALARQGRPGDAVPAFRRAIDFRPDFAEAHSNLGNAYKEQGCLDEALECCRQAVRLQPHFPGAHNNLGNVLAELGQLAEAEASCRTAVRLNPRLPQAHNNLGVALARQKRPEEAEASFRRAAELKPEFAQAHNNLGMILDGRKQHAEAAACFREAIRSAPRYAEAHTNLGLALRSQNQFQEAEASFRRALEIKPESQSAIHCLGSMLFDRNRFGEAEALFREAVRLRPDCPRSQRQLGLALLELGRPREATERLRRVVELRPEEAQGHNNLGVAHTNSGEYESALASYAEALRLVPDGADAHWNRSLVWLLQGDLARGWPEYEWRWKRKAMAGRGPTGPVWDGSPLDGRKILLRAEQGMGDTLNFVRYAAQVKARGAGQVILECQGPLVRLMGSCPGVDQVIRQKTKAPPVDVQVPLLTLPGLLGTTAVEAIPAPVPYLSPDPAQARQWRDELAAEPGVRVGITWQGNPQHRRDRDRSVPLSTFAPLAAIPGVRLFSLQRDAGADQLAAGTVPAIDLGKRFKDMGDTAAALRALDLVVCVDTSVAHLAGALGVPCWVAIAYVPDWRWLLGRETTPWYPSLRLFRQRTQGDWGPVFAEIAEALRRFVAGRAAATSVAAV